MPASVSLFQRGLAEARTAGVALSVLVLCGCALARADVYVLVAAYDLEPLPDLEADFGPAVPSLGVEGVLRVADPHDACQPFSFVDFDTPWIALISRQQQAHSMNCTFDIKVMHAQLAGASAAIVYDDFYESLIIMSMPKGHEEPSIPSVFVTERSGFILTKLLEVEGKDLRVRIMPVTTVAWLEALVSTLLGLMSITMVIASFYAMRSWGLWLSGNQRLAGVAPPGTGPGGALARVSGLPASAIHALPVIIYDATSSRPGSRSCSVRQADKSTAACEGGPSATSALEEGLLPSPVPSSDSSEHDWPQVAGCHAGETKRVCTVCLEDYTDGEKVRVLPCLHRFHKSCVDQWLSSRRTCPVCKHDAGTTLAPPTAPVEGLVAGRQGVRDRLARMGGNILSWMGLSTPASVDPAAELLLSRSPPASPTHETARRAAPRLRQSRLWDLYLAYAALETEPPQGAAAATAAAAATGAEAGAQGDVEAGAAAAQATQAAGQGQGLQGPAQALFLEESNVTEAQPPALRSVRDGPSPPIHIPAAEGAPAHVAAAAVDGQRQLGHPGAAAASMQEPGSMPFPSTPPMQAPANPASRS